jgi:hypothetical protein
MIGDMDASAQIHIDRLPTDVFAYVMQVSNDANWRTGVVEAGFTTEPPVAVGTEGFDRVDANGRSAESRWRVIEWEPGSHARWDLVSGPIAGTGGYICAPGDDGGTEFTLEAHIRPAGLYRLLGPIFGLLGRRQNRADVAKLKSILET